MQIKSASKRSLGILLGVSLRVFDLEELLIPPSASTRLVSQSTNQKAKQGLTRIISITHWPSIFQLQQQMYPNKPVGFAHLSSNPEDVTHPQTGTRPKGIQDAMFAKALTNSLLDWTISSLLAISIQNLWQNTNPVTKGWNYEMESTIETYLLDPKFLSHIIKKNALRFVKCTFSSELCCCKNESLEKIKKTRYLCHTFETRESTNMPAVAGRGRIKRSVLWMVLSCFACFSLCW